MKKTFTKESVMEYTGMSESEYHTQYQRYWRLNRRILRSGMQSQAESNIPSAIIAAYLYENTPPTAGEDRRTPMFDRMREELRYVRDKDKFKVGYTRIRTESMREKWGNYRVTINVKGEERTVTFNEAFNLYERGEIDLDTFDDAARQVRESDTYINYESSKE